MGKKIVISERLIAKLIGHDGSGIKFENMGERRYGLIDISKVISMIGSHARRIKNLHPSMRI